MGIIKVPFKCYKLDILKLHFLILHIKYIILLPLVTPKKKLKLFHFSYLVLFILCEFKKKNAVWNFFISCDYKLKAKMSTTL